MQSLKTLISGASGRKVRPSPLHANVLLLVASFGLGQGSLFLAQSWLIFDGQSRLIGLFGASFTFYTLAYYFADWGGVILLARLELSSSNSGARAAFFTSLCLSRLTMGLPVVLVMVIWQLSEGHVFTAEYALFAAPALVLGMINPSGVLDGVNRSGLTGMTTAFPILISALALPIAATLTPHLSAMLLGGAFTIGSLISVSLQYAFLQRFRPRQLYGRPTVALMKFAFKEGGIIMLTLIPGYTFYRVQVGLSLWLLGPATTGLFIYSKQIANGLQQLVYFVRRAEMPRIMAAVIGGASLKEVLRVQRSGWLTGSVFAVVLFVAGLSAWMFAHGQIGSAGLVAAAFSPVIAASTAYAALHQAHLAAHRSMLAATVANSGFGIGIILTIALVPRFGLYGFPVAEFLMAFGLFLVLARCWPKNPSVHATTSVVQGN